MAIKKDTLDQLLEGRDPQAVFSKDGLFDELKKALPERVLNAELDNHLDSEAADGAKNRRNGYSKKTVLTETAKIDVRIPRDREGTFDPKLIQRYQRRFPGFDDKIVSMYARGMTVREIQGHLLELYGLEVSPDLISTVTDAVLETVAEWQNRPLETSYPLVFFDAIRVKIRDEGLVRNKAVYLALGVAADGTKDILGHRKRDHRGRQILAQGDERAEGPRRRGHPDRRGRRPEGLSGGDRGGLSAGRGSDLHRPSHPQFAGFRVLERPEARRRRATENLPRRRRRGRPQGLGGLRGRLMGPQICGDRPDLAATMGADHPVLRLRSGRAQNRLHHECHRGLERQAATGRAGDRPFPQRRGG